MKQFNAVLMVSAFFLSGCVSIGTYERNMKKRAEDESALKSEITALTDKIGTLEADLEETETLMSDVKETYENLLRDLRQEISDGTVRVDVSGENLTITVGSAVLFRSGSADLQAKGMGILQQVSNVLKDVKDRSIRIDGHSDNVPISGALRNRFPSNWELSSARAASVARHLESLKGIDPTRIFVAAFAEFRPVGDNTTREGRAQNRRVEINLVPDK